MTGQNHRFTTNTINMTAIMGNKEVIKNHTATMIDGKEEVSKNCLITIIGGNEK